MCFKRFNELNEGVNIYFLTKLSTVNCQKKKTVNNSYVYTYIYLKGFSKLLQNSVQLFTNRYDTPNE